MLSAARPLARMFLDVQLPDEKVIAEVQRLVGNLVAMHELLRDASRVSMRLVMTPDRMVVAEAMRTFTYLNLYGYLTDAVVVNRVFPDELVRGLLRRLARRPAGAARAGRQRRSRRPGPEGAVLRVRGDRRRAAGRARRGDVRRRTTRPPSCTTGSTQELSSMNGTRASLRLDLPFAERGRRVAEEDRARADRARGRRTSARSCSRARWRATSRRRATLEEGSLTVGFEHA